MTGPVLLVVAKAPVPGLAKTRIAATTGDELAAELAAAALLDTLDTVAAVGRAHDWPVVVSMTGDLSAAARGDEIAAALAPHTVVQQRGDGLAERLAHAHADASNSAGPAVVQVGMDTPQLTAADYEAAAAEVLAGRRVLGPADDGGWWLLGLPDAAEAGRLVGVPMSTDRTAELTEQAIGPATHLRTVLDMDSWDDARSIAAATPGSRLAILVDSVDTGTPSAGVTT